MAKVKTSDWYSYGLAVGRGYLSLSKLGESPDYYWMGDFYHPAGIVSVYRQHNITRLDFVHSGRTYIRSWDAYWGDRTINQLARQFVSDVLEGEV